MNINSKIEPQITKWKGKNNFKATYLCLHACKHVRKTWKEKDKKKKKNSEGRKKCFNVFF